MVKIPKQITIKLNEERFGKLLEKMNECTGTLAATRSELVGKAVWFLYVFSHKKIPKLGNKTHFEHMIEQRGITKEQFMMECRKKYLDFIKTNKPF